MTAQDLINWDLFVSHSDSKLAGDLVSVHELLAVKRTIMHVYHYIQYSTYRYMGLQCESLWHLCLQLTLFTRKTQRMRPASDSIVQ